MVIEYVFVERRSGREYTRMRVRARDNFTCQDCGDIRTPEQARKTRKRLFDVHHLNGICGKKSRGYDKESDMPNLITLCHKCHFNRPDHAKVKKERKIDEFKLMRDKEISDLRLGGETYQKIANKFKISRQRAHQIFLKVETLKAITR